MRVLCAILLVICGMAQANPDRSLRPPDTTVQDRKPVVADMASTVAMDRSLRPQTRPRSIRRIARQREKLRKRGAVCGDLDIQGVVAGRIAGTKSGCGVAQAVRIRSISGVTLSQRAVMDCTTAKALKTWVDETAKPTFSRTGGGLKALRVAAHYACRTRNNRPGARISEHGKGRAIDISAVQLRDGTLITVRNGWRGKRTGPLLRQAHRGACGPFGTVLGPAADRYHQDHFHFDTARHRGGPYCR